MGERDQPIYLKMALFWMLLSVLSLISFSIDLEEYGQDRMQYLCTMFMVAMGYQFVSARDMPNVGYMTLMDWYSLQTFGFLFGMLIESALALRYELWVID